LQGALHKDRTHSTHLKNEINKINPF